MERPIDSRKHASRFAIAVCRTVIRRLSISKWMLLIIGLALCGYAVFAFEYYTMANAHRELLRNNSTYIEFERQMRDVSASHQVALFAATNAANLPLETVKSTAVQFVEAARSAAKANTVSAFEFHFAPILSGATMVEEALSKPTVDLEKLREGLDTGAQMINLLVMIAAEGRKAEWENLMEGSQSNFISLIALIGACAVFVAAIGYLITSHIRRTFANVTGINPSIASGDLDADADALRAALASFRALGQRWKRARKVAIVALIVALGFVLVVYRTPLWQIAADLVSALGIAESVRGIDAADAAYQNGDFATALRLSRPMADQGDARAQTLVGLIYYNGRGVPRDDPEATRWFRRAADQGDATAQFYLGVVYFEGRGVPQNYFEGAKWYRRAADQGNAQAQYNLGIMYMNGEGVPQNRVNAHMWFNLAAAHFSASSPRNRDAAARNRDLVARKMSREEIVEAQKLAREWKPKLSLL